jgi:hypothetical protein
VHSKKKSTPSFPELLTLFFGIFFFFFLLKPFSPSRLDCRQVGQQVNVNGDQITCRQQDILDQATKNVLLRVLQDMKTYVGELLYIVRADSISIGGRWCFDPNIDISRYSASSSDAVRQQADVMMMVTAWPTAGNTVAWASACRSDQFGRSIAGHMNYGPGAVGGRSYKMIYTTALHELFHALGFSGNRFQRMLRPDGSVFSGATRVTIGDARAGTKTVTVINSPNVLREVRAHTGCHTLAGMEIEGDGGGGSVGSHWEQRVAGNEVESPSIPSTASALGPLVSRFTLALFEDLGVYYPDYRKVTGNYAYGRGQGCVFSERPTRERNAQYQCPRTLRANKCNPDSTGYSSCQWFNYGRALPLFEQPDTASPTQGGNEFSDYAVEAQSYQSCRGDNLPTQNGQNGGPDSVCLMNSVVQGNFRRNELGAGCFELKCPGAGAGPPAPTAPAPTAAPTTSGGGNPGSQGPLLRQYGQCEECNAKGGRWCDGGWALPNLDRYGVCIDPRAESCPSWAPSSVDTAAECYPKCNYGSTYIGTCRGASYCSSAGGIRVSTQRGATGCERQPAQYITCCITHRIVGKRDAADEPEEAVAEKPVDVVVAEHEHEKRQAGHQVRVGNKFFNCPAAGGQIQVDGGFSGVVQCPSLEMGCCASKSFCNGRGQCYHGSCVCNGGFTGDSCEQAVPAQDARAPSRSGQRVNNYLMEEDLPPIDVPPKTDEELGRVPLPLPDDFGEELGMSDEDAFGKASDVNGTDTTQTQSTMSTSASSTTTSDAASSTLVSHAATSSPTASTTTSTVVDDAAAAGTVRVGAIEACIVLHVLLYISSSSAAH